MGDELLDERHDVGVVGIGLVQLEHRELGIPPVAETLVAEHPPDLEHLLHAPDDKPLQIELRRDAQVHIHVERVVMGHERLGGCPAGDRVKDRCLDLDEVARFEEAADLAHHLRTQQQREPGLVRDPQVDVPLPVARVRVGDAVPLVGELSFGFGQQRPLVDLHRQLAALGRHDDT